MPKEGRGSFHFYRVSTSIITVNTPKAPHLAPFPVTPPVSPARVTTILTYDPWLPLPILELHTHGIAKADGNGYVG